MQKRNRSIAIRIRSKSNTVRTPRGVSVAVIVAVSFLIIVLIVAAFYYAMITGGAREVRNAVDAASLNVSKRVMEVKVTADPNFRDIADSTGMIGMSNINRMWGKAYLINANEQSMQTTGQSTGNSSSAAEQAFQIAQGMNDQLYQDIVNKQTLDVFFNQIGALKPARLLGADAAVTTGQGFQWATAMIDRGDESNISVVPTTLPPGVSLTAVQRGKNKYIQGYVPITANNRQFCFTTFHLGETAHLISDSYFTVNRADKNPVAGLPTVIPNAFQETGAVSTTQTSLSAAASSTANPQLQFQLAIPHAFVKIVFSNTSNWYVEGKKVNSIAYGCRPQTYWGAKDIPLPPPPTGSGGQLNGYASLGNEYKQGSVWDILNLLQGNHQPALNAVLQRVQEIDPTYTMGQLKALMLKQAFVETDKPASVYYIFATYNTPDNSDPHIQMQPSTGSLPGWLNPNFTPDGLGQSVGSEAPQTNDPNTDWETIIGGKFPTGKCWTEESGNLGWIPGTGLSQCLGTLHIARETDCFFTGEP